jgi:sigma-B regulation protein RsbU (phosphoserine phosphatase)
LLVAPGASPLQPYTTSGLVAGFRAGEAYESDAGMLAPGEMLVFFSDGIPEAWSASGVAFGQERLVDLLATRAGHGARDTVDAVVDAVHQHAAGTSQSDDITVLALRRSPAR